MLTQLPELRDSGCFVGNSSFHRGSQIRWLSICFGRNCKRGLYYSVLTLGLEIMGSIYIIKSCNIYFKTYKEKVGKNIFEGFLTNFFRRNFKKTYLRKNLSN